MASKHTNPEPEYGSPEWLAKHDKHAKPSKVVTIMPKDYSPAAKERIAVAEPSSGTRRQGKLRRMWTKIRGKIPLKKRTEGSGDDTGKERKQSKSSEESKLSEN